MPDAPSPAPCGLLVQVQVGQLGLEQLPRDAGHDAGAVAGHLVGGAGAAVLHAAKRQQRLLHDGVVLLAAQVRDEADLHDDIMIQYSRSRWRPNIPT